jgi:hypothetical protein
MYSYDGGILEKAGKGKGRKRDKRITMGLPAGRGREKNAAHLISRAD